MIDLGQAVVAMGALTFALMALVSYQALKDNTRINVAFAPPETQNDKQYSSSTCEC